MPVSRATTRSRFWFLTASHHARNDTHTITTTTPETTDGIFQIFVDVSAMALGDVTVFKIKEKARSGDTQRILFRFVLSNVQLEPIWCSPVTAWSPREWCVTPPLPRSTKTPWNSTRG